MLAQSRIAVTGSSGFVGAHLVRKIRELGAQVLEIDTANGSDISEWSKVKGYPSFEVLVHLAGKTFVPDSYATPREFLSNNIIATLNALELCRTRNARMIYASSYVYGHPLYLPIDESHPIAAYNPYSESKIIGERLCEMYHRDFGLRAVVLRVFNIYGVGQREKFLIPSIIAQCKMGQVKLKDEAPKRDFVYIDDAVEAYVKAMEYGATPFEVFNIGGGESYSVREIVEKVVAHFGGGISISFSGEKRRNEVLNVVANISKAATLLGWKPRIKIGEGLLLCAKNSFESFTGEVRG
jgi:nucleoside-diphosphate-sugar epimerase